MAGDRIKKKKNYVGKHFYQSALPSSFQGAKLGQSFLGKFLVSLLCLFFLTFSSSLLGLLVSVMSRNIIFYDFFAPGWFALISPYVLLSMFACITALTRYGFSRYLSVVSISIAGAILITFCGWFYSIVLTAGDFDYHLYIEFPLTVILIGLTFIGSFLLLCYSLVLGGVLSRNSNKVNYKLPTYSSLFVSLLASGGFIVFDPSNNLSGSGVNIFTLRISTTLCTFLVCSCLLHVSLEIAQEINSEKVNDKYCHFVFLRNWAKFLGAWYGTSFYGLDISHVDFQYVNLSNTDFRASKLYRTKLQGATGLGKSRVDNQYLDLKNPKVQSLLTQNPCRELNFRKLVLRGAYLKGLIIREADFSFANLAEADFEKADLRSCEFRCAQLSKADLRGVDFRNADLTDSNLTGANCQGADFRGANLTRAQVAQADFTGAFLTGTCIEDWSVSSSTIFRDVHCGYIFKQFHDNQFLERYPTDRDFESGEFSTLFKKPDNLLELVFKGDFSHAALSLAFEKLAMTKPDWNLSIRGIEQRDKLWVVTCSSTDNTIKEYLTARFSLTSEVSFQDTSLGIAIKGSIYQAYEEMEQRLKKSEEQVSELIGVTKTQSQTIERLSNGKFGTNLFILGGQITNLVGQGSIEYNEAASRVRNFVVEEHDRGTVSSNLTELLNEIQSNDISSTKEIQTELLQQVMLHEINSDDSFRYSFLKNAHSILKALPDGVVTRAVSAVLSTLDAQ